MAVLATTGAGGAKGGATPALGASWLTAAAAIIWSSCAVCGGACNGGATAGCVPPGVAPVAGATAGG
eukprot:7056768-Alexandrium_andersonii.AAC.1